MFGGFSFSLYLALFPFVPFGRLSGGGGLGLGALVSRGGLDWVGTPLRLAEGGGSGSPLVGQSLVRLVFCLYFVCAFIWAEYTNSPFLSSYGVCLGVALGYR